MKIKDSKHASAPIGWLFLVPELEFLQLIPGSSFLFVQFRKIEVHINLFSYYMKAGRSMLSPEFSVDATLCFTAFHGLATGGCQGQGIKDTSKNTILVNFIQSHHIFPIDKVRPSQTSLNHGANMIITWLQTWVVLALLFIFWCLEKALYQLHWFLHLCSF